MQTNTAIARKVGKGNLRDNSPRIQYLGCERSAGEKPSPVQVASASEIQEEDGVELRDVPVSDQVVKDNVPGALGKGTSINAIAGNVLPEVSHTQEVQIVKKSSPRGPIHRETQ
jgi:hypothetical protein